MSGTVRLPDVLPITSKNIDYLNKITVPDLSQEISNSKTSIQESTIALLSSTSTYPEEKVKQLEEMYKELLRLEEKQKFLSSKLIELKAEYKEQSADLPRLDLENWNHYLNNDYNLTNIRKKWIELQSEEVEINKKDQWLRVFYALPYIWSDPSRVIPYDPLENNNSTEEEEDIKVDGGVIDLNCPVSLKKFNLPMISLKCFHTFDDASLKELFRPSKTIECPTPGCGKVLTTKDFTEDKLMRIRVLISDLRKQ